MHRTDANWPTHKQKLYPDSVPWVNNTYLGVQWSHVKIEKFLHLRPSSRIRTIHYQPATHQILKRIICILATFAAAFDMPAFGDPISYLCERTSRSAAKPCMNDAIVLLGTMLLLWWDRASLSRSKPCVCSCGVTRTTHACPADMTDP